MTLPSFQRLAHALLVGKPYFGLAYRARQGHPGRQRYFLPTVRAVLTRKPGPLSILEIGSWAGSSSVSWAKALERAECGGRVTCVDSWAPYFDSSVDTDAVYAEMNEAAETDDIFQLFLHNIRACDVAKYIQVCRGDSREVLGQFPSASFDIIYIDGSHQYDIVKRDIAEAIRLVSQGGIVCGDDLELQLHQIAPDEHANLIAMRRDCVFAPSANSDYHPGVTAAVAEKFGVVNVWDGFWAVQADGAKCTAVDLDVAGAEIPDHLLADAEEENTPPRLVGTKGAHNIVAFRGKFFAIPQSVGPIDLAAVDLGEHPDILVGRTKTEVERQISTPPKLLRSVSGYNLVAYAGQIYAVPHATGEVDLQTADIRHHPEIVIGETEADVIRAIRLPPPRLVKSTAGYNLVDYAGRVYGVPQSSGPLDLQAINLAHHPEIIIGDREDEVEQKILASAPAK